MFEAPRRIRWKLTEAEFIQAVAMVGMIIDPHARHIMLTGISWTNTRHVAVITVVYRLTWDVVACNWLTGKIRVFQPYKTGDPHLFPLNLAQRIMRDKFWHRAIRRNGRMIHDPVSA